MEIGSENCPAEAIYIKEEVKEEFEVSDDEQHWRLTEDVKCQSAEREPKGEIKSSLDTSDIFETSPHEENESKYNSDPFRKVMKLNIGEVAASSQENSNISQFITCDFCKKQIGENSKKLYTVLHDGNEIQVCFDCYRLNTTSVLNASNCSGIFTLSWTNIHGEIGKISMGEKLLRSRELSVSTAIPVKTLKKSSKKSKSKKTYSSSCICDICNKKFTQRSDLNKHAVVHTKERRYVCDVCKMRFTQKGNLKVHMRLHTGEHPFSCDICRKTFGRKNNLEVHRRIHTGERHHSCYICAKAFNLKSDLVRHYRVHTGERPYSCGVCLKTYSRRTHLRVHQRNHKHDEQT